MASSGRLLVAALDFGTTYSRWAVSFRHEFKTDPLMVTSSTWMAGSGFKTPTTVLLDKDKKVHSFGYEAEEYYSQLAKDDEQTDWYYFRRFKMMLYDKERKGGLTRNVLLKDIRDRELPALKVFSEAIKYFKGDIEKGATYMEDTDIEWVLTVPAIWDDPAKQFMREAAEEAGIKGNQLTIALEPEAALLYCKHLPVEKMCGSEQVFTCFSKGSKHLVLDFGETTVDFTVHEVQPDGSLKELDKASGGSWGGSKVDESFRQMLVKIVGNDVMQEFAKGYTVEFDYMMREFEKKKYTLDPITKRMVTMKIPIDIQELFEEMTDEDLNETIEQTNFSGKLIWLNGKLRMHSDTFRNFFSDAIESIIDHLEKLIAQKTCERLNTIIMVGEFSQSPLLQSRVKECFGKLQVIIPEYPELAVLKGAVIFGHTPKISGTMYSETKANFLYGFGSNTELPRDRRTVSIEDGKGNESGTRPSKFIPDR